MSVKLHPLKVIKVVKETKDAVSIQFEVPQEDKEVFKYKQGQFLALQILIDGKEFRREYSLSSSPYTGEPLTIACKKVPTGQVSTYIYHNIKEGDVINVFPPNGKFYSELHKENEKTYLLIGGGSGITPLFSILKSVLVIEPKSKVILYYGNYCEDDIIFRNDIDSLVKENPDRFKCYYTCENPVSKSWSGMTGVINRDSLSSIIDDNHITNFNNLEVFICGPTGMMDAAKASLLELNIPSSKLHIEYFTPPVTTIKEAEVSAEDDDIWVDETTISARNVTVILDGDEHLVKVPANKYILDAAMEAGLDPPYSCRSGICTTCRAKLLSGEVKMDEREGLSDSEIEEGFILTCQSHPLTDDVKIEYD